MLKTSLKKINKVTIGYNRLIDQYTKALWVFDGSEVEGMVKDWSDNKNHLVSSYGNIEYDFSIFGKVGRVRSGEQFTSLYPLDIELEYGYNETFEIICKIVPDYLESTNPNFFNSSFNLFGPTSPSHSLVLLNSSTRYLALTVSGLLQIGFSSGNNDLYSFANVEENHYLDTDTTGAPFYKSLNWKTWQCIGVTSDFANFKNGIYLNGVEKQPVRFGNLLPIYESYVNLKINPTLVGDVTTTNNRLKNIAAIRVSNKPRTLEEHKQFLNMFSSARGYIKHFKIFDKSLGDYEIKKISTDSCLLIDAPLSYSVPVELNYTRTSTSTYTNNSIPKVYSISGLVPSFDFKEDGSSLGLHIETNGSNLISDGSGENSTFLKFPSTTTANYNFDNCIEAVHGNNYMETNSTGFMYKNINYSWDNDQIYTYSVYLKESSNPGNNNPRLVLNFLNNPGYPDWDFDNVDIIDSSPEFVRKVRNTEASTHAGWIGFEFDRAKLLDWKRCWVTFKMALLNTPVIDTRMQIINDNRNRGLSYAMDCLQLEPGFLTSVMLDSRTESNINIDLNTINRINGTILFDYFNYNNYSGIIGNLHILNIGDSGSIIQSGLCLAFTNFEDTIKLTQDLIGPVISRLALTWDRNVTKFYRLDTIPDQIVSGIAISPISGNFINCLTGSSIVNNYGFYIKNFKVFERALSLEELKLYD